MNAINFGDYAQVHRDNTPTNSNKAKTVGGIALHPSGNEQGGWMFISLASGKRIHGRTWDEIPISEDMIDRVHAIAKEEGQPLISDNFVFELQLDGEEMLGYDEDNIEEKVEELL